MTSSLRCHLLILFFIIGQSYVHIGTFPFVSKDINSITSASIRQYLAVDQYCNYDASLSQPLRECILTLEQIQDKLQRKQTVYNTSIQHNKSSIWSNNTVIVLDNFLDRNIPSSIPKTKPSSLHSRTRKNMWRKNVRQKLRKERVFTDSDLDVIVAEDLTNKMILHIRQYLSLVETAEHYKFDGDKSLMDKNDTRNPRDTRVKILKSYHDEHISDEMERIRALALALLPHHQSSVAEYVGTYPSQSSSDDEISVKNSLFENNAKQHNWNFLPTVIKNEHLFRLLEIYCRSSLDLVTAKVLFMVITLEGILFSQRSDKYNTTQIVYRQKRSETHNHHKDNHGVPIKGCVGRNFGQTENDTGRYYPYLELLRNLLQNGLDNTECSTALELYDMVR